MESANDITFGWHETLAEGGNWREYAQAFFDAGLQVEEMESFKILDGVGETGRSCCDRDFVAEVQVNSGVCEDVEESGAHGSGGGVGASKAVGMKRGFSAVSFAPNGGFFQEWREMGAYRETVISDSACALSIPWRRKEVRISLL